MLQGENMGTISPKSQEQYTYCGDLQYYALIALAVADADRVSKLEAENAELKAMVGTLAEDAATVKE